MRPWTPSTWHGSGSGTIAVKRCCNGCGRELGDVTDEEVDCAVAGRPLPDVRGECWLCRGDVPTRALTLTRPWGWHVLRSGKDVENRSWPTGYRGPLLVHHAKSWEPLATLAAARIAHRPLTDFPVRPTDYHTGIGGVVDVVGCCMAYQSGKGCACGPWAVRGQNHWLLANPIAFAEPIPCAGRLGLWDASEFREQIADALHGLAR